MRQQVRESNQELRILESQLRTAYVSKALASQKKEREALILAEKIEEKAECERLEMARLQHLADLKKKAEIEKDRKTRLHKDLTDQIITAHQQRVQLYEEFLRDKYYLDEIAERLKEELSEQIQKKITMKEKTKKEMDSFKIIKKELERQKEIETREENQRILEYCELQEKKIQEEEKRRNELEKNRKNLNEKMVAELTTLEVSLILLQFVCEREHESGNVLVVGETLTKALEKHWLLHDGRGIVCERNDAILVSVHLLDNYVNEILHRLVDLFILMLEDEFSHQVYHLLASNLILARHIVDLEAKFYFLLQRAAKEE